MGDTVTGALSALLPDYTPSWIDGFVVVAAAFELFINSSGESSSWEWAWVVAGFALCILVAGPIAKTSLGRFAGDWFREIGIGGRAALIVVFLIGLYGVFSTFSVPKGPITSLANGVFLWVIVFVPIQYLYVNRFREQIQHDT